MNISQNTDINFIEEIARDDFGDRKKYEVIGGIISPVHDLYNKPGLVSAQQRCAMVKISLQTSDWIRLSDWECKDQVKWTRTRVSLQYHQVSSHKYDQSLLLPPKR